ncbi:MAG: extracellular solute-binding protein [Sphaerochaeta sp.]|nr:extracellular solute-binding protein [Sphaerochaeta sp.]
MKKLLTVALVVMLVTTGLFAQGGQEKDQGSAKKLEIHYANFSTEGESHFKMVDQSIKNFNAANPNIKIMNDLLPSAAYTTNIQAVAASNDLPQISMLRASQAQAYGLNGVILPLNDLLVESGLDARMRPGVYKESSVDGVIYGIPWAIGYYGFILYNSEIFDEVGIKEFPKNLDEFKVACDTLNAAGYIPMALGDKPLWPADSLTFSAFVNKFVGPDWTDSIVAKDGTASFLDADFIAALTAFQKLAKDGTFNVNLASLDHDERRILYSSKKAAMISAGDWECVQITREAPDVAAMTKVAAWPGPKNGAKAGDSFENSSAWTIALSANNSEAETQAAMDYLANYHMTPEWGKQHIEVGGSIASWEHEIDKTKINPIMADVYAYDSEPCLNWDGVMDIDVREVFQRGLQSLLTMGVTPQQLASKMQAEYVRALKK